LKSAHILTAEYEPYQRINITVIITIQDMMVVMMMMMMMMIVVVVVVVVAMVTTTTTLTFLILYRDGGTCWDNRPSHLIVHTFYSPTTQVIITIALLHSVQTP
jgi:hypothetical protein